MSNAEYQRLLRSSAEELRERLLGTEQGRKEVVAFVGELNDGELRAAIRDLGGHDLPSLLEAYREADAVRDRPSAVFAYTIKGRSLPI